MGIVSKPEANYTPVSGNYKTLKSFRYWCQKVLPLVYDDSLSYYELLCKVVDYLNKTMEDVETLHGDVTNLHEAYVKLQSYINDYFSTLDIQKEINNKLDEMVKDGTLDTIIANYLNQAINNFISQRVFRIRNKANEISFGQGCCFTGTTFLLCGDKDSTSQRIAECNQNGDILRSVTYEDSHMGHANGIAKNGNYVYVVNGVTSTDITILNYETLTVENYITQTKYDNVYGICEYNETIYVLCRIGNVVYICKLTSENTLEEMCHFTEPTVYTSFGLIRQGFCIIGNYAYIVYNYNNNIIKVNINSGLIYGTIDIGMGDGYYPYGEVETTVNVNNQLYMLTTAYIGTDARSMFFIQMFKTNVGGICVSNGNYGQSAITARTLVVSADATSNNPDGINNPFYDIEEACIVYTYLCNLNVLGLSGINVTKGDYDTIETFFMCSVFGTFSLENINYKYIGVYDSSCCIKNAICETMYIQGNVTLYNCTCNKRADIREGTIHIIAGSYNALNFIRCSVTLSYAPDITSLTQEQNNTFKYVNNYMVGNQSISRTNNLTMKMTKYFWWSLVNEIHDKYIAVIVSGGQYGFRQVVGRIQSSQIRDLLSGTPLSVDMQTVIMGDFLYIGNINVQITHDNIIFSFPKCASYDGTDEPAVTCSITDFMIVN